MAHRSHFALTPRHRHRNLVNMDEAAPLRVLLADDHPRYRRGIRERLTRNGVDVIAECGDGRQAVALAQQHSPDVVLMDIHMPGVAGPEATAEIMRRSPDARVVMLTIAADEATVMDAMLAGASGYVVKSAAVRDLLAGIRAAAAGETFMSPQVASKLLMRWRYLEKSVRGASADTALSSRELEVLRLIAEGHENTDIADRLMISTNTVKRHVAAILTKLRAANRTDAAVQAVRDGLI
jgi:DNA-binding NarL/FixJ family response regulator